MRSSDSLGRDRRRRCSDHAFLAVAEHLTAAGAGGHRRPPVDERRALLAGADLGDLLLAVRAYRREIVSVDDVNGAVAAPALRTQ
jgi:hypothetical protein